MPSISLIFRVDQYRIGFEKSIRDKSCYHQSMTGQGTGMPGERKLKIVPAVLNCIFVHEVSSTYGILNLSSC